MFCDKNLMDSEILGNVWKLAHNMSTENIDEVNLPEICNELDSWVSSEAVVPSRRLSLRTSSNLIGGAAKLYKHGLDKLYDDVNKLNEDIIYRRKRERCNSSSASENSDSSSDSTTIPELMRRQYTVGFDSSFSPIKRIRIAPISPEKIAPRITISKSTMSNENILTDDTVHSNGSVNNGQCSNNSNLDQEQMGRSFKIGSDVDLENVVEEPISKEDNPGNQRKDEGVQTSPILISKNFIRNTKINSRLEHGFDRNQPFGYILIHDSYGSRIPSKIIFTSINSNINNLI